MEEYLLVPSIKKFPLQTKEMEAKIANDSKQTFRTAPQANRWTIDANGKGLAGENSRQLDCKNSASGVEAKDILPSNALVKPATYWKGRSRRIESARRGDR